MREDALWGGTPRFYALAYFVGAFVTQALFLAVHEISHNLAFKSFTHNKLFGIFTNIPMILPFFVAFKHYHNVGLCASLRPPGLRLTATQQILTLLTGTSVRKTSSYYL
jgi:hypothetical protein